MGWNYFNSSWNNSRDIKLTAGDHSLEIGWTGAGKYSEEVGIIGFNFLMASHPRLL
jgi:hypothetical protein